MSKLETVELVGAGGRVVVNKHDYHQNPERWLHYKPVNQKTIQGSKPREDVFLEGVLAADTAEPKSSNPYKKDTAEYEVWNEGFDSIHNKPPAVETSTGQERPAEEGEQKPKAKASKAVLKLVEAEQVDIRDIPHSGASITVRDVQTYVRSLE